MDDDLPRRLRAVMFTDIKGFSALMSADEARTVRLVEEHRTLVREVLARHRGHEHETIGDAFVILFDAATDAVACALELQSAFRSREADGDPPDRIYLRVGIHMDEVITREGQLYGRGVNIAARIEPLARPGGVCVTEPVWSTVKGRIDVRAVSMGIVPLKNIPNPPALFQLDVPGALAAPAVPRARRRWPLAVTAAVVVAFGALAWIVMSGDESPCEDPRAQRQYDEAVALLLAAEPSAAERRFAAARDIEPEEPLVWIGWGVAAAGATESWAAFAEGAKSAAEAAAAHPEEEGADLAQLVARQVADRQETDASVEQARAWVREHPRDHVGAAALLAAAAGRASPASPQLAEDVVAAFPEDALVWVLASDVHRATDVARSRDCAARAAELAPGAAEAWSTLGMAEHRLGAFEAARENLRRALEIDADRATTRLYLVRACMRLGDDGCLRSQVDWARSPQVDPIKRRSVLGYVGLTLLQAGRPKAAEPLLEEAWRMADEQGDHEAAFWPLLFRARTWELGIADVAPSVDARLAEAIGSPELPALARLRYDAALLFARAGRAFVAGDWGEADRLLLRLEALGPDEVAAAERARQRALRLRVLVSQGRLDAAEAVPASDTAMVPVPRTPVLVARGDRSAALAEVQGFLHNQPLRDQLSAMIAGHALEIAEAAIEAGDTATAEAARLVFREVWPAPEEDVPFVQRMKRVDAALGSPG